MINTRRFWAADLVTALRRCSAYPTADQLYGATAISSPALFKELLADLVNAGVIERRGRAPSKLRLSDGSMFADSLDIGEDESTTITIDNAEVQINGVHEAPPCYHPSSAERIANDLLLAADAARQAAFDGYSGPAVVFEIVGGTIPDDCDPAPDELYEPIIRGSNEQIWEQGNRAAWNAIMHMAVKELEITGDAMNWQCERMTALQELRRIVQELGGEGDWPARLHLADVLSKYLWPLVSALLEKQRAPGGKRKR